MGVPDAPIEYNIELCENNNMNNYMLLKQRSQSLVKWL